MIFDTNAWKRFSYTLWAPFYDLIVSRLFGHWRRRSMNLLALVPGQRVLMVGAGTGLDLCFMPRDVDIVATDLTPAMLARLRRRAERLGIRVDARVMDGQALDLPDSSFDAVVLHLIVAVIPDPVACLREAARVLRPGGRVAIFDKFVPDGVRPPLLLRMVNPITRFCGSEFTRQLGPFLAQVPLRVIHDETAGLGGLVRIVLLEKH